MTLKSEILIYNWLANLGVIELATEEPRSSSVESLEILGTDDSETICWKKKHNDQILKTLEYKIDENLYEEILQHYARDSDSR